MSKRATTARKTGVRKKGGDSQDEANRTGDCLEEDARAPAGGPSLADVETKAQKPNKVKTRSASKLQEEREENNRQVIELADKILANVNPEKLLLGLGCRQDKNDQTSSKQ